MLPDSRRLNREDLQDAPAWVDPMLTVINAFMDSVYNIMNRNISLTQNLNIQIATINIETDSNGDIKPIRLKTSIRGKVVGISTIRVVSTDLTVSPTIYFTQNEDILLISNIASLNNNEKYRIIILIIGE